MEIEWVLIVKCSKSLQEIKSHFPKSILIPLPFSTPHWNFMWCKGKSNLPFCEADLDFLFYVKNNYYWKKQKVWETLTVTRQYVKNF